VDHALQPLEPQIDPRFCDGSFSCICYNMSCRAQRAWGRRFLGMDDTTGCLGSYKHPNFTAPALDSVEYDGSDEIITECSDIGRIGSGGRSYSLKLRNPTAARQQQQNQRTGQKLRQDANDDDDPDIDSVHGSEANTTDDSDGDYQPPKKAK